MQTTRSSAPMTPSERSALAPRRAGGTGRFAAQAAGADLGFGVQNLLIVHLAHHALANIECPQALQQVDRPIDFDGAGDGRGPRLPLLELGVISCRLRGIGTASVPA